jgi:ubiquinone/menaquinone biosynthesis C-methylase UbiE
MQRVDAPEILDSDDCSPADVEATLQDLGRVNRWFGGVTTSRKMVERIARVSGAKHFSLLEVAAGSGEVPKVVQRMLARCGITLDVTLLDRQRSHLPRANHSVAGDALALPFDDGAFDLISCNLFAHHLPPQQLEQFVREGLRVSRRAVLINDLVRHPLHLALAFAGYPIMRSRVAWLDGLTSVRRAYVPEEIRSMLASAVSPTEVRIDISRHYLFRMGVIVWKSPA